MLALLFSLSVAQASPYVRTPVGPGVCAAWRADQVITISQTDVGLGQRAGTEFEAVSRALSAWNASLAGCASVQLVDGPRTTSRQIGYDLSGANQNVVLYRTRFCEEVVPPGASCRATFTCESSYDCFDGSAGTVALTTATVLDRTTGEIVDADIEFNSSRDPSGRGFVLTTVDSPACPAGIGRPDCVSSDIQATATHELGHLLGLEHTTAAGSTMRASVSPGLLDLRTLDVGTSSFGCQVYAKGRSASQCTVPKVQPALGPLRGCSVVPSALGWLVFAGLRRRSRR